MDCVTQHQMFALAMAGLAAFAVMLKESDMRSTVMVALASFLFALSMGAVANLTLGP